jgi:two-component system, chemotaxis family, chemotaxis protein CheY
MPLSINGLRRVQRVDNSKTVLVVDDASLVRLFYRSILEGAGFRVEEALNGLEALERLQSLSVDLLIVDINMPQMDGFTFLNLLRQKTLPIASIPALVTSTESQPVDFEGARLAGANYYLVKPIDRNVLLEFAAMLSGLPP